jgi:hypothetical protein
MNEAEWLAEASPQPMLSFLQETGRYSDRKVRLFSCACCRRVWGFLDERLRRAVQIAEAYADGRVRPWRLEQVFRRVSAAYATVEHVRAWQAVWCTSNPTLSFQAFSHAALLLNGPPAWDAENADQAALLRCIVGNPFSPVALPASLLTANVVRLARAAYEERALPSGHLDNDRLAVLADALEEAGCTDKDVLLHLRQPKAVHVRGCFVVDLLLNKA